jgi:Tfp pilus assembly PilM family ATPase
LIGVDLSGRWMKAVQFGGPRISASARMARKQPNGPFSREDALMLAGVFERAGFRGNRLVISPPREAIIAEVLELPPRGSGAPIEQLARIEVARTHKCDPSSFELGLWDLPSPGRGGGEQSHVFAAAMPFARSEPLLDACESAGLEVHAIDVPAAALARAYGVYALPDAMLDVGWTDAMLCVVHQGAVVYERNIEEAGLRRLVEGVATKIGLPPETAEAVLMADPSDHDGKSQSSLAQEMRGPVTEYLESVAQEVRRSLAYMGHRYQAWQFKHLSLSGDGATLSGLREKLAESMQVTVSSGVEAVPDPSLLVAAGSARHGTHASRKEAA